MVMVVEVIPPLSLFLLRFLLLILLLLVGLEVVVEVPGVMHHLHFNINHCHSSTADNNRQASCGQDREK